MACPYFSEGKHNLCCAVDGLMRPSIYEEKTFCRSECHVHCGIYRLSERADMRITTEYYIENIQDEQFHLAEFNA